MARAVEFLGEALAVGLTKHLAGPGESRSSMARTQCWVFSCTSRDRSLCPAGPPGRHLLTILSWGSLGSRLTGGCPSNLSWKEGFARLAQRRDHTGSHWEQGLVVLEKDKFQKYREQYSDFLL